MKKKRKHRKNKDTTHKLVEKNGFAAAWNDERKTECKTENEEKSCGKNLYFRHLLFAAPFPLRKNLLHYHDLGFTHLCALCRFVVIETQKVKNTVNDHKNHLFIESRSVFFGMSCDDICADEDVTQKKRRIFSPLAFCKSEGNSWRQSGKNYCPPFRKHDKKCEQRKSSGN